MRVFVCGGAPDRDLAEHAFKAGFRAAEAAFGFDMCDESDEVLAIECTDYLAALMQESEQQIRALASLSPLPTVGV